jgi:peptidoglycan/xylan/chitin deacetylase (PgdA/CDA1 family)
MPPHAPTPRNKILVACTIDFDALSGWLGTGQHPATTTADYSSGYFSAHVGVPRLLALLTRLHLSQHVTWCLPGHSIETFPAQTRAIVASGAEIALHGYAHEAASQLTAAQERAVLEKCTSLVTQLTGRRPQGYRAPLYQLQERTIALLQEYGFLWDSSLAHHDSAPYFLPRDPEPVTPIAFTPEARAQDWMHPTPSFLELPKSQLVEIPCNWYMEDMTPLQFFPNVPNSAGYVDVRVVERMWMDRFEWLIREIELGRDDVVVYSMVLHPDTSGMAHVIGMVERFVTWVLSFGDEVVEFRTCASIAEEFRRREGEKDGDVGA